MYLEGITVRQSPAWCVHLIYCSHVSLNGVSIFTKFDENGRRYEGIANGDGLDPDSCSYVNVFGCTIGSQDDCIAVKSGRNEEGRLVGIASEHIRVTNCTFTSGFGVAMGSEMSGGVRDCLVQDCVFSDVYSIGSIKTPRGRGSVVENIVYENLRHQNLSHEHQDCKWFRGAIYVDEFYSHDTFDTEHPEPVDEGTSVIRGNGNGKCGLSGRAAGDAPGKYLSGKCNSERTVWDEGRQYKRALHEKCDCDSAGG